VIFRIKANRNADGLFFAVSFCHIACTMLHHDAATLVANPQVLFSGLVQRIKLELGSRQ
jgi:hypothetical protein